MARIPAEQNMPAEHELPNPWSEQSNLSYNKNISSAAVTRRGAVACISVTPLLGPYLDLVGTVTCPICDGARDRLPRGKAYRGAMRLGSIMDGLLYPARWEEEGSVEGTDLIGSASYQQSILGCRYCQRSASLGKYVTFSYRSDFVVKLKRYVW